MKRKPENSGGPIEETNAKYKKFPHDAFAGINAGRPEGYLSLVEIERQRKIPSDYVGYDDDESFVTTQPPQNVDARLVDVPDGWAECCMTGYTKRQLLAIPDYPAPIPHPPSKSHCISDTHGRGLGIFATRRLQMGDLIFSERPIIVTPSRLLHSILIPPHYTAEQKLQAALFEIDQQCQRLLDRHDPAHRAAYMSLHNCHLNDGSGPAVGILRTNGFSLDLPRKPDQTFQYSGVFKEGSRFNHNCSFNVERHWDNKSFSMLFRARCDIEAGDELTVYYCDTRAPASERAKALKPFGFQCSCSACLDPVTSDRARIAAMRHREVDLLALSSWLMNPSFPDDYLAKLCLKQIKQAQDDGLHNYLEGPIETLMLVYRCLADEANAVKYGQMLGRWHLAHKGTTTVLEQFGNPQFHRSNSYWNKRKTVVDESKGEKTHFFPFPVSASGSMDPALRARMESMPNNVSFEDMAALMQGAGIPPELKTFLGALTSTFKKESPVTSSNPDATTGAGSSIPNSAPPKTKKKKAKKQKKAQNKTEEASAASSSKVTLDNRHDAQTDSTHGKMDNGPQDLSGNDPTTSEPPRRKPKKKDLAIIEGSESDTTLVELEPLPSPIEEVSAPTLETSVTGPAETFDGTQECSSATDEVTLAEDGAPEDATAALSSSSVPSTIATTVVEGALDNTHKAATASSSEQPLVATEVISDNAVSSEQTPVFDQDAFHFILLPETVTHSEYQTSCWLPGYVISSVRATTGYPKPLSTPAPLYRIGDTKSMGLGVFSTRSLKMGDLILSERPLMVFPPDPITANSKVELSKVVAMVEGCLLFGPGANRDAFLALDPATNHSGNRGAAGRAATALNHGIGFTSDKDAGGFACTGVFAIASKINHSCSPNASLTWNPASFSTQLRATRDIAEGEELFLSYLPYDALLSPCAGRRQMLLGIDGFRCICTSCSVPDTTASDRRRAKIAACKPNVQELVRWTCAPEQADDFFVAPTLKYLKIIMKEGVEVVMEKMLRILSFSYAALDDEENAKKYGELVVRHRWALEGDEEIAAYNLTDHKSEPHWGVRKMQLSPGLLDLLLREMQKELTFE